MSIRSDYPAEGSCGARLNNASECVVEAPRELGLSDIIRDTEARLVQVEAELYENLYCLRSFGLVNQEAAKILAEHETPRDTKQVSDIESNLVSTTERVATRVQRCQDLAALIRSCMIDRF